MSEQKKPRGLALIGKRVLEAVEGELPSVQSGAAPRTELAQRGAALSKLSGDVIYGQSEWIDPALCRPSELNARDYNALTYEDCADLIETIKSEGQQRTAATVRRTNDPDVPYEIIAGNRRHWSVSWLRANNYPEFRYLITVASMDDEAAFRWSDLENRARQDITDLERGRSYKMALESFYGNNKVHMADRLGISRRSLTRYIDLAELDPVLIEALGGHRQVSVMHAQEVKALASSPEALSVVVMAAKDIAVKQKALREAGDKLIPPSKVLHEIAGIIRALKATKLRKAPVTVPASNGKPMLEYATGGRKSPALIKVLPESGATRKEILKALTEAAEAILDSKGIT